MTTDKYHLLAQLLEHPEPGYRACAEQLLGLLRDSQREAEPGAALVLSDFLAVLPVDLGAQQELYTRTFEVQATTTLAVGYVLFGDDYKRGALLASLNREHGAAGNDCRAELADHLPNLLRLLPRLHAEAVRAELLRLLLMPALLLMLREFEPERLAKKNAAYEKHYRTLIAVPAGCDTRIYGQLLQVVVQVLAADFALAETLAELEQWSRRDPVKDFMQRVQQELEIEYEANPGNSGGDA